MTIPLELSVGYYAKHVILVSDISMMIQIAYVKPPVT